LEVDHVCASSGFADPRDEPPGLAGVPRDPPGPGRSAGRRAGRSGLALREFDLDPLDPQSYGNTQRYIANWVDFSDTGTAFIPFLNEGIMMTNVRLR